MCSNLGTAPSETDAIVFNIGTSAAVRALVPGPVRSVPAGLWEYRVDRSRSLLGGAESNGGNVAAWLRDLLRGVRGDDPDDVSAHLPPDGHGLTVLPFLAGERSPGWDDAARATIHGARLNTQPADLLLAGIEAVAYRLAAIYDLLVPVIGEPHVVHVSGGALQRSDRWTQILADVLGRPIIRSAVAEPTSRGAAIWALQEAGTSCPGRSRRRRPAVRAGSPPITLSTRKPAPASAASTNAWPAPAVSMCADTLRPNVRSPAQWRKLTSSPANPWRQQ